MKQATYFLFLIIPLLFCSRLNATSFDQDRNQKKSVFTSLAENTVTNITLETNIDALIENKHKDEYQKAILKYKDAEGSAIERKIKVKARGKYRNRVCDFPPLKIKFSKDELTGDNLEDYNKLKLVSHCFEAEDGSTPEQLMKEFLAYKTFNLLSKNSFRVKLALVTYKNSKNNTSFQQYAILIESTEELAARIQRFPRKMYNVQHKDLVEEEIGIVSAFQFMIGNRDWDVSLAKNIKTFPSLDGKEILVVPYDFDFSGFVNASYATHHPNQKVENIKERLCFEKFRDEASLEKVLSKMEDKKDSLLNMIETFEHLSKKQKKEASQYILSFYLLIEDRKKAKEIFLYKPSNL